MIVAIDSDASYHHSGYWLPRPIFVCEHINFPSQVVITGALAAYLLRGARGPVSWSQYSFCGALVRCLAWSRCYWTCPTRSCEISLAKARREYAMKVFRFFRTLDPMKCTILERPRSGPSNILEVVFEGCSIWPMKSREILQYSGSGFPHEK